MAADPAPVTGTSDPAALEGRYIVVLQPAAGANAEARAQDKVRANGGDVRRTYSRVLDGFSAKLPPAALDAVRRDPAVAYIEADREIVASVTQTSAPYGLDRIDQRNLPLSGTYTYTDNGTGVTAYVIDTGIRTTHTQFGGRARSGFDAIDGGAADDCNGHGTHVAGSVGASTYGVAKSAALVAVRVLNCSGSGSTSGVIQGVDWVTGDHDPGEPAVANMSLGGGASTSLDQAVQRSIADGVSYAVAAGNDNANACNGSPARVANALTVGSTTSTDARSSFSNFGTCLDVFAPGSSIISAWYTSDTATQTISGTSMASPHVAGAAAVYLDGFPGATPAEVATAVNGAATPNVVGNPGSGSPNRLLYATFATGPQPTPTPSPSPSPSPTATPSPNPTATPSPSPTATPSPSPTPPPTGCGLAESYSGSLSGTGASFAHPAGGQFTAPAGTHRGCLRGPATADFDIYLERRGLFGWSRVAQGTGATSTENVTYNGSSGTYRWRVVSYSGSGSYTFGMTRP